jgi:hypothetical protein
MRILERNKQKFFFSLFIRKIPIVCEGLKTGEYEIVYTTPKLFMANISPAKGLAAMYQFGIAISVENKP